MSQGNQSHESEWSLRLTARRSIAAVAETDRNTAASPRPAEMVAETDRNTAASPRPAEMVAHADRTTAASPRPAANVVQTNRITEASPGLTVAVAPDDGIGARPAPRSTSSLVRTIIWSVYMPAVFQTIRYV